MVLATHDGEVPEVVVADQVVLADSVVVVDPDEDRERDEQEH